MLSLTPDVNAALEWFELTHECVRDGGGIRWRRIALPHAGGVGEQDTRLLESIEYLRQVHDTLAAEDMDRAARRREIARWREERKDGQT